MSELPGVVFQNTGSGSPLWRSDGDVSEPEFFNKPLRVILLQLRVEWELLLPQSTPQSPQLWKCVITPAWLPTLPGVREQHVMYRKLS